MNRCWQTVVLLVSVFYCSQSLALNFSIYGLASLSQSTTSNSSTTSTSDANLGYGAGLSVENNLFGPGTSWQLGAQLVQRVNGYPNNIARTTQWIQVPLLLRLNLGPASLGLGAYYGMANGDVSTKTSSTTVTTTYRSAGLKTSDYGGVVALGLTFSKFLLEARYLPGISDVSDTPGITVKFNDYQILAGFKF